MPSPSESSPGSTGASTPVPSEMPGMTAANWNRRSLASPNSTPLVGFIASMVRPSPMLIATCAFPGRPLSPGCGSHGKLNSRAPGVSIASSTGTTRPSSLSSRYWRQDACGRSTPTRPADQLTRPEQSNVSGSASSTSTAAPNT